MLRILVTLMGLLVFCNSYATTVKPVSLDHMAQAAEVIFYGRVIGNDVRLDETSQRVATFTTFEILEAIKGTDSATYTIKQFGGQLPGSKLVTRIQGMPQFTENKEYVVFLPAASRSGFASPIGLMQGSFSVSSDSSGKSVSNGRAIGALLSANRAARPATPLDALPAQTRRAPLNDFLQSVRTLSGN